MTGAIHLKEAQTILFAPNKQTNPQTKSSKKPSNLSKQIKTEKKKATRKYTKNNQTQQQQKNTWKRQEAAARVADKYLFWFYLVKIAIGNPERSLFWATRSRRCHCWKTDWCFLVVTEAAPSTVIWVPLY